MGGDVAYSAKELVSQLSLCRSCDCHLVVVHAFFPFSDPSAESSPGVCLRASTFQSGIAMAAAVEAILK